MESKSYKIINLKFFFSLLLLLTISVTILLYLLSTRNFLPIINNSRYNWLNISVFSSLIFISLSSFLSLIFYLVMCIILKKEDSRELKIVSIRWGTVVTVGLLIVVLLNFFHILDIYWGLALLLVAIITSFII